MALQLFETSSGFEIEINGARFSITNQDVLNLVQSVQSLRDRILAKQFGSVEVAAVPMTEVDAIDLNTDLHRTEIHLQMIDRQGLRSAFSLPPRVAQALAERLPVRLAEISNAKRTTQ